MHLNVRRLLAPLLAAGCAPIFTPVLAQGAILLRNSAGEKFTLERKSGMGDLGKAVLATASYDESGSETGQGTWTTGKSNDLDAGHYLGFTAPPDRLSGHTRFNVWDQDGKLVMAIIYSTDAAVLAGEPTLGRLKAVYLSPEAQELSLEPVKDKDGWPVREGRYKLICTDPPNRARNAQFVAIHMASQGYWQAQDEE